MYQIYHNPQCKKSREGLKYLQNKRINFQIKKYHIEGISSEEHKKIFVMLDKKPLEMVRKQESDFKNNYKGKSFSDDEWVSIISKNLKLLQRPIIVHGYKAVLANPPENLDDLIK